MSEFKVGDKVIIEGEIVEIDKFSQYQYKIKLDTGRLIFASEKEISGYESEIGKGK